MDPVTAMRTGRHPTRAAPRVARRAESACGENAGRGPSADAPEPRAAQWKLSPQAQLPLALGLSIVKPCFSMVSAKSIVAPSR